MTCALEGDGFVVGPADLGVDASGLVVAVLLDVFPGTQWGNFPQAFSHEELPLTILELDRQGGPGEAV